MMDDCATRKKSTRTGSAEEKDYLQKMRDAGYVDNDFEKRQQSEIF